MRYHEFISYMLRKEREMAKKTTDPFSSNANRCDKCGYNSPYPMPFVVNKYVRNTTQDYHFCSAECHNEFYLDQLRTIGL